MSARAGLWLFVMFSAVFLAGGHLFGQSVAGCLDETPPVTGMDRETIRIVDGADQAVAIIQVRIARTEAQRAAGMQHLCPDAIADNPMLFVFNRPGRPAFHMNNVHAPLDMLFIDDTGQIVELHRMTPGPRLTQATVPIRYALELAHGTAADLGIEPGHRLIRE